MMFTKDLATASSVRWRLRVREIYPIYWSPSQMQARQSDEMAAVQSFLNRLWRFEQNGKRWFDPDVSVIYLTVSAAARRNHVKGAGGAYRFWRAGALAASRLSAGFRQRL